MAPRVAPVPFLAAALAAALVTWAAVTPAAASPGGSPAAASAVAEPPVLDAPVDPVRAASLFDPPPRPWLAGHRGIDLLAPAGDPVRSPATGVVTFAGRVVDRGVVTVDHGPVRSSLEPVSAQVRVGDMVVAGQLVGTVEDVPGHCAPASCVHWGVRRGDVYLDPLDLLRGFGPVVLLPDR